MQQNQPTGVPCPECNGFIPIDLDSLLTELSFRCPRPGCGTVLNLDRTRSRQSLQAMEKLRDDLERARRSG